MKIDILRLSDESIPITASYSSGRSIVDRETGSEIGLGCNLAVAGDAFSKDVQYAILYLYFSLHHSG